MSASTSPTQTRQRPSSPLATRTSGYNTHSMANPAHRSQASRSQASRSLHSARTPSLKLPSLPRFHPANFPSQGSSSASTPTSNGSTPQPPVSPRSQQRQYSEAQKQLYAYQRELLATSGMLGGKTTTKPVSPRLIPAGSPGPVTPLELEGAGGYLTARAATVTDEQIQREYVDKLISEEAARRGELPPNHTTVGSY